MTTTSASLLERVRKLSDQAAWKQFVLLYTPLLYFWVRRTGFSEAEAGDLVQEVFAVLVRKMPDFVYEKGRTFRGWLRTVAVNKWRESKRKKAINAGPMPDADVADPAEHFWEDEYRQHLYRRALTLMQTDFPEKSWQACWQMVVDGKPASVVAAEQGTTVGAVHAAKFRILSRLREELAGMMD